MSKPKVISLFSGIGGLDHGFEAAGFNVGVAVERDTACVRQLRRLTDWAVIDEDIHHLDSHTILKRAQLAVGEPSALIGGPPCQPFSKAGYWARGDSLRLDDERAGTLEAYLRVLRDTLPETFLLENVEGLAFAGKSEGLELIRRTIDEINECAGVAYSVEVRKLNAADYGVPQTRERIFIVGHREGRSFQFPMPTHAPPDKCQLLGLHAYRTAWDAIGDLEDEGSLELAVRGKWAALLPSIPEGENYLWHTDRKGGVPIFGWRRRYWSFLLKLSKRLPAWTIQAQPGPAVGPFHWRNRRLSQIELCRLQTLPKGSVVDGSIGAVQRQLGNAVPSALAEVIALQIRRQLLGHRVRSGSKLIPAQRLPVPDDEPVADVPREYRELIGEHDAHPGTGLGFGALERQSVIEA